MMNAKGLFLRTSSTCIFVFLAMTLLIVPTASALLFDADLPRETKVRNLNLLASGTILTWGALNWDYFQQTPQSVNV